ncbi:MULTISPECIES: phage terminase large subunit [unclassified Stenotrophomonas]|uniref:phage terminase large subunit n=1 Tax=unclassified Stenotrophomonas TaxID=196198 RepID=UPI00259B6E78|nr:MULTISPECIES: phage terminase large subunit [unclassified Stenotrophomonas]WNB79625.1 phage terminase large subunit [Stenotrophomonas sp. 9]
MNSTALNRSSVRLPTLAEIRAERARRAAERERARIAEDVEGIRARSQTLEGFIKEHWRVLEPTRPLKFGWALRAMCRHLEAVTEGRIQFLLMTVPPGMMKSLLMVFWTAWEWGPVGRPDLQTLATSYSQPNVLRDNLKLRRLIESDQYQAAWPMKLRGDQNAKGKFENTGNGFSEARPFSSMTGGRGDRVKVDDPHSTETAESDAERKTAVRIFREGITDRLNDITSSAMVIIMQRLHQQDVAAVAMELDLGFVHLNLPMEFEAERVGKDGKKTGGPCRTYVDGTLFFEDPRTVDGELLFPERFPRAEVERLKRAKGSYAYAGQYQQRPTPRDGGTFKREWFEVVDGAPAISAARKVRRWDFGATDPKEKTSSDPDYTVGLLLGEIGGIYYVLDIVRGQESPAGVERMLKNTALQDGKAIKVRIPQDPGAAGKSNAAHQIKLLAGWDVKAALESGSKEVRATPVEAQAEAGNIKLVNGPWVAAFLEEIAEFPNAKHDDQVDALSGAFAELVTGSTYNLGDAL